MRKYKILKLEASVLKNATSSSVSKNVKSYLEATKKFYLIHMTYTNPMIRISHTDYLIHMKDILRNLFSVLDAQTICLMHLTTPLCQTNKGSATLSGLSLFKIGFIHFFIGH